MVVKINYFFNMRIDRLTLKTDGGSIGEKWVENERRAKPELLEFGNGAREVTELLVHGVMVFGGRFRNGVFGLGRAKKMGVRR